MTNYFYQNRYQLSLLSLLLLLLGPQTRSLAGEGSIHLRNVPAGARVYANGVRQLFIADPTGTINTVVSISGIDPDKKQGVYLNVYLPQSAAWLDSVVVLTAGEEETTDVQKFYNSPKLLQTSSSQRAYLEFPELKPGDSLWLNDQDVSDALKKHYLRFRTNEMKDDGWYRTQVRMKSASHNTWSHGLIILRRGRTATVKFSDLYKVESDVWGLKSAGGTYGSDLIVPEIRYDQGSTLTSRPDDDPPPTGGGGAGGGGGGSTPPITGSAGDHEVGILKVAVPEGTRLYVDGRFVEGRGTLRIYRTKRLLPGQTETVSIVKEYPDGRRATMSDLVLRRGVEMFIGP